MPHVRRCLVTFAVAGAVAGNVHATPPDPVRAAAGLVRRLRADSARGHVTTFAASTVVARGARRWLAVASTFDRRRGEQTHVRVYRWRGGAWRLDGTVVADLGPSQWVNAVSLTGSRDPDFAIQGCGAGDTNCLGVVSDIGGRWHAVPLVYGYGTATEVNGVPDRDHVVTEVDACGCAGGPSTWTYERYERGLFRPATPPGPPLPCTTRALEPLADPWQIKVLRFDHVACADGWALAVGTGAGFTGRVVGLFVRVYDRPRWELLTLDNGNALPTAPAMYDLPLALLDGLGRKVGGAVAPELAAARLIARLQARYAFHWPLANGIVRAHGRRWLVAIVPARRGPNESTAYSIDAIVYRWNGRRWTARSRVRGVPRSLNLEWFGGWFTAVPAADRVAVAFGARGGGVTSPSLITDAGASWHVVRRRRSRSASTARARVRRARDPAIL